MNRRTYVGTILGIALVLASGRNGLGQEAQFFHAQFETQLSDVDRSASDLLDALVAQPKEVRDAAMVVAEHPDLAIRLKFADRNSPEGLGAVLKDYPAEAADAGRTLASHGDVIELLAKSPAGTAVLGRVHAQQREVAVSAADRMSQRLAEQRQETSEAWAKRLTADTGAAAQLTSAPGGMTSGPAGKAALPTGQAALEILQNADKYSELASAIVDQWENERNPEEFRRAVDTWYAMGRDVLPWDFTGDAVERAALLAEYARFDRQYREILATGEKNIDRLTLLSQHADGYPKLIDVYYKKQATIAAASRPKIAGGPFTSGGGGGSSRSGASSRSSSSSRSSGMRSSRSSSNRSSSRQNRNGSGDNSQGGFGGQGGFGNSGGGFGSNSGGSFGSSGGGFGGGSGGFGSSSGSGGFGSSSGSGFGSSGRSGSSQSGFGGSRSSRNSSSSR